MTHDPNIPLVRLGQGDYTRDYYGDQDTHGAGQAAGGDGKGRGIRGVLTSTRLGTLRRCPRQHYYRYELGLSRQRIATPLRIGAAFHKGLEHYHNGLSADRAISLATDGYQDVPDWANPQAWRVEHETVRSLLAGHFLRYGDLEFIAIERSFNLPLINPDTGRSSRTYTVAGKIDAIVKMPDGTLAVLEYKTAGEDIGPDSDYWLRLRIDPQISLYVLAARSLGYDVATVLYDVTRKPTIRLRKTETPDEYSDRLTGDIADRPDYYFARREIPRLEADLAEFQAEVWQQAKALSDCRRRGAALGRERQRAWFRNVGRFTCGTCAFANLCMQSINVSTDDPPPGGFRFLPNVHPELATGDHP